MRKESYGARDRLMKTKSSGAGAMFTKRTTEPELCHFYESSATLK